MKHLPLMRMTWIGRFKRDARWTGAKDNYEVRDGAIACKQGKGGNLFTEAVVRRFGADFVFEVEMEDRAGEGFSIAFKFRPRIGYNRSARLLEQMEQSGLVSAMNGNGSRDILVPATASEDS